MSGLSGARVTVSEGRAIKIGGDAQRTRAQGRWIAAHDGECLPSVISILDEGYTMERLFLEPKPSAQRVIDALAKDVWTQDAEVEFVPEALEAKLELITDQYARELHPLADDLLQAIIMGPQTPNLTHGDPTAENIMTRLYGELVVIDPIPATPAVPDLREVDHGKMLQSAIGWETIRGNDDVQAWSLDELRDAIGEGGIVAAAPWCAVHLLRALPYAPEGRHDAIKSAIRGLGL